MTRPLRHRLPRTLARQLVRFGGLGLMGCTPPLPPTAVGESSPAVADERRDSSTSVLPLRSLDPSNPPSVSPAFEPDRETQYSNRPSLPPDVVIGELSRVRVDNYRAAHVAHAPAHVRRALVYLHGVCGDVTKIADWVEAATEQATVVAPGGDKPCSEGHRYSWSQDVELIHRLIERTLAATRDARAGLLDIEQVAIFGYSQGASRAERLAALHPARYRWVLLGGPPSKPQFERLSQVQGLVLLAGSKERLPHLRSDAALFTERGLPASYFEFAGVGHGAFGPSSPAVMTEALRWLFEQ